MHWYLDVLKKYVVFEGRARRTEYWVFGLISAIISLLLSILDNALSLGFLGSLYSLAVLLPSLGVSVRRLHDTNRSGWWLLIGLVPVIGWIVLLVFMLIDSDPQANEYGPNPKYGEM
ncbi:MAG TPA: DUF805 domain-containing protein [Symbiobacteriaceae bacterium]|nr:DUF805 domain-containing protein [Symbiobacteriaceae bacterium]